MVIAGPFPPINRLVSCANGAPSGAFLPLMLQGFRGLPGQATESPLCSLAYRLR